MQFKNIKKSPSKKVTAPNKSTSSNIKKEEIKEIIEETVEEVLKEQSDPSQEPKASPVEEQATIEEENAPALETREEGETESTSELHLSDTPFEESGESQDNKNSPELEKTEQSEGEEKHEEKVGEVVRTNEPDSTTPTVPVVEVSPFSTPPNGEDQNDSSDTPKKSSMLRLFLVFMLIGIAAGALLWLVVFHNMFSLKLPNIPGIYSPINPTPTRAPSLTLSPTPKPVDISQYTITVLNGSGIAGAAAKAKATLTNAGFTVGSTGNASSSNFTQTVIAAKSSVDPEAVDKLKQTLGETYAVSSQILSVSDSQTADIVVTIGSSTK